MGELERLAKDVVKRCGCEGLGKSALATSNESAYESARTADPSVSAQTLLPYTPCHDFHPRNPP